MRSERRCSRTGCTRTAVATLTYVYRDSTAVIGPLATASEPHSYDLCAGHAGGLTAPRGWDVVRADGEYVPPVVDDLTVLAEAVREATWPATGEPDVARVEPVHHGTTRTNDPDSQPTSVITEGSAGRRGHLRVLPRRD